MKFLRRFVLEIQVKRQIFKLVQFQRNWAQINRIVMKI